MSVQESTRKKLEELTDSQLRDQIAQAAQWCEALIDGAEKMVLDHGEQTFYRQGSDYTHTVHRLSNFFDFTIEYESGRRYKPDGPMTIWYHPEAVLAEGVKPVCKLDYPFGVMNREGSVEERFEILILDDSTDWRTPLQNVLDNHEAMLEERKRIAESERQKRQQEVLDRAERDALLKQASQLKIG